MNKILIVMLMSMVLFSFASATDCWATFAKDSNISLIQKCPTCTYVNITAITYPNGTVFLNDAMTQDSTNFNYTLPDSSQIGTLTYTTIGDKYSGTVYQEDLCIDITLSGSDPNLQEIMANIIFILFFAGILLTIMYMKKNIDADKYYNKVVKKYKNNFFKRTMGGLAYEFMRDVFITVYVVVWLMLGVILNVAYNFNMVTMYSYMTVIVQVVSVGFVLLGLVFLARMVEVMSKITKDIDIDNWGIGE